MLEKGDGIGRKWKPNRRPSWAVVDGEARPRLGNASGPPVQPTGQRQHAGRHGGTGPVARVSLAVPVAVAVAVGKCATIARLHQEARASAGETDG
ncbi:hypothetical protein ZWY2020_040799 [Hordeum vulgare]|nr:hypothetical protein ZWY2020_040799 [Hordeum vulgare]